MRSAWTAAIGVVALFSLGFVPQDDGISKNSGASTLDDGPGLVLSSGSSIEPLTGLAEVPLDGERGLHLSPGVRFTPAEGGYSLATHDGRALEIQAGRERIALPSPVIVRLTDRGMEFGGDAPYSGRTLTARRYTPLEALPSSPAQDRKPRTREIGKKKLRVRWLYSEDPRPTAEVFNTEAIQQLVHLSPMGF